MPRADRLTVLSLRDAILALLHIDHTRAGENAPALPLDRRRESPQIIQRMELPLVREADRRPSVEPRDRRVLDPMHIEPRALARFELVPQVFDALIRRL